MDQALSFLHTSPVHVQTFRALLADLAPDILARHVVDEDLLCEAQALRGYPRRYHCTGTGFYGPRL